MDSDFRTHLILSSLANPRLRFRIQSTHDFNVHMYRAGSATTFATWFDTLGDGDTQHTPDRPVSPLQLGDFCASTLQHLLTTWDAPSWRLVASLWPTDRTTPDALRLLRSLKFNAEKREWYSVDLAKRTHNRNKSFDSRWQEVPEFADGSPNATIHLIERVHPHDQLLARLVTAICTVECHNLSDREILQRYCGACDLNVEDSALLVEIVRGLQRALIGFRHIDASTRIVANWSTHARRHDQADIAQSA